MFSPVWVCKKKLVSLCLDSCKCKFVIQKFQIYKDFFPNVIAWGWLVMVFFRLVHRAELGKRCWEGALLYFL